MHIIEPNAEMLAITRLYLEKYEALAEADRKLFRDIIRGFAAPRMEISGPQFDVAEISERLQRA
jgi:hypothetical protein